MMKKISLFIVGLILAIPSYSEINYKVNKYGVMSVYFVYSDSLPTIEMFSKDCEDAINTALSNKKVSQVHFRSPENNMIFWVSSNRFEYWRQDFENVIKEFPKYDVYDTTKANVDSVLVTKEIPAKYHEDTYENGVLTSTFTTDWDGGQIAPKTSQYRSEGYHIEKKTYVVPRHIEKYWRVTTPKRDVIKKGEEIKLQGIYKRITK